MSIEAPITIQETVQKSGFGGVDVNTIIDSVQKEEPKRASPVGVERAYIHIYKGPAESRSELCLSLAKTPVTGELLFRLP